MGRVACDEVGRVVGFSFHDGALEGVLVDEGAHEAYLLLRATSGLREVRTVREMKTNRWLDEPPERLFFSSMRYEGDGLVVELCGATTFFSFLFPSPIGVRSVGDGHRGSIWTDPVVRAGQFWCVADSDWLADLRRESGALDGVAMEHYLFVTDDQCVDVASMEPPRVSSGRLNSLPATVAVRRESLLEMFRLQLAREIDGLKRTVDSVPAARQRLAGLWRGMYLGFGVQPLEQSFEVVLQSLVVGPLDALDWLEFEQALGRLVTRISPRADEVQR